MALSGFSFLLRCAGQCLRRLPYATLASPPDPESLLTPLQVLSLCPLNAHLWV